MDHGAVQQGGHHPAVHTVGITAEDSLGHPDRMGQTVGTDLEMEPQTAALADPACEAFPVAFPGMATSARSHSLFLAHVACGIHLNHPRAGIGAVNIHST